MKKVKIILSIAGTLIFLFSFGGISGINVYSERSDSEHTTGKSTQTNTKTTQTVTKPKTVSTKTTQTGAKPKTVSTKSTQTVAKPKTTAAKPAQPASKAKPAAAKPAQSASKPALVDPGIVTIGQQHWAVANLNVSTFRNGDSIPEAKTNQEWLAAGEAKKPAWCYYNNDPAVGKKYGKLYNWYAVNDPRELAPAGWKLSSAEDWKRLAYSLGGAVVAGTKMKSTTGWLEGNNGYDDSGFTGLPGGYRIENGIFKNSGSAGSWWSTTESKTQTAIDNYLSFSSSLGSSSNPKQRGESVRCLKE